MLKGKKAILLDINSIISKLNIKNLAEYSLYLSMLHSMCSGIFSKEYTIKSVSPKADCVFLQSDNEMNDLEDRIIKNLTFRTEWLEIKGVD